MALRRANQGAAHLGHIPADIKKRLGVLPNRFFCFGETRGLNRQNAGTYKRIRFSQARRTERRSLGTKSPLLTELGIQVIRHIRQHITATYP
jgi:hypothetical protein